jgi:undecaprenyl-diphosphatase
MRALLDPDRTELPALLALGAVLLASLWLLFVILKNLIAGNLLVQADEGIFNLLESLRVEWGDSLATAVAELGDGAVTLAVAAAAVIWLATWRAVRAAIYGGAAVGGAVLFAAAIGSVLPRPQPIGGHAGRILLSGPGSHVAVAVALYGLLTVLIGREVGLRWRLAFATGSSGLIAALAFARLYLGADWLSTIMVSLTFGVAWVALLSLAYVSRTSPTVRPVGLLLATLVTLALLGGLNISRTHRADLRRYAVAVTTRTMTPADWQDTGWETLPLHRLDLVGEFEEPFTIQWAGSPDALRARLVRDGWTAPASWLSWSALGWLSPQVTPGALPVLPRLNNGRVERLVMVKTGSPLAADERLVLRMWRSDVVMPSTAPLPIRLWIGTVVIERVTSVLSLGVIASETPDMKTPVHRLAADLTGARIMRRHAVEGYANWDGTVLLAEDDVLGGAHRAHTDRP